MEIILTNAEHDLNQCAELMSQSEPFKTLKIDLDRCMLAVRGDYKEVYIAKVDGHFAGFVVLTLYGVLRGYIQTICIKPEFRNRGIGSSLLQFSEERLLKDFPNVFMCVSSFNYDAQRLYKRLGFEQIGILKDHFIKGYDEYILRKQQSPIIDFIPARKD